MDVEEEERNTQPKEMDEQINRKGNTQKSQTERHREGKMKSQSAAGLNNTRTNQILPDRYGLLF